MHPKGNVIRVSHRAAVHTTVALTTPIVFNVSDMRSRAEENLLVQTISTKIRLKSYNPDWDDWWNRVAEEIPGRLPMQCRACYMSTAFLAQLTWFFLRIAVGRVRYTPPVYLMTSVLKSAIPLLSLMVPTLRLGGFCTTYSL
jgi:hypothetical protein